MHVHKLFFFFEKSFLNRCRSTTYALRMLPTVCVVGKTAFYWEELGCQNLEGGFKMSLT